MEKKLTRRSFMLGCGLLTISTAGVFFTGCNAKEEKILDGGNMPTPTKTNASDLPETPVVDAEVLESTVVESEVFMEARSVSLSQAENDQLEASGFLNYPKDKLIIYKHGTGTIGFSSVCPHQGGELKIESADSTRCTKHTVQTFTKLGVSNGPKTPKNLQMSIISVTVI